MSLKYPIIKAAQIAKEKDPNGNHCALNPCCQGTSMMINDVRVPFCNVCFNWLPLDYQEEMYIQAREAFGWQYARGIVIPPSYAQFSWLIKRIVGISYASHRLHVTVEGQKKRKMGGRASWEAVGQNPRCEFEDRHGFYHSAPSFIITAIDNLRHMPYSERGL